MDVLDGHVVDRLDAIGLDGGDGGDEALAVGTPLLRRQALGQPPSLGRVREADAIGEELEVVIRDQERGLAVHGSPRRCDAESDQHPLHVLHKVMVQRSQRHCRLGTHRRAFIKDAAQVHRLRRGRRRFERARYASATSGDGDAVGHRHDLFIRDGGPSPSCKRAMVVQHDLVTRLERARSSPVQVHGVASPLQHSPDQVIRRQPQRVAFPGLQREHRLRPGREEARRFRPIRLAIDDRQERRPDQVRHLARSVPRQHPGLRGHARIRRADRLAVMQVVVRIDPVQEEHARLGVVVGGAHDLVPQLAGPHPAVDPQPVGALRRAGGAQLGAGRGLVHQLDVGIGLDRLHERVAHAHRDVEVLQVPLVLRMDEGLDVRVVAAQHAHLRTAPRAGRLHRLAAAVEHPHVADRAGCARLRRLHVRALRPDPREVVTHPAAAPHRLRRFGQRGVNAGVAVLFLGDRIAHRLDEAVDQGGRQGRARRRGDPPRRHEAAPLRLEELRLPVRALLRRLRRGQRPGHPRPDLIQAALAVLGVLLEQHLRADVLRRQGVGRGLQGRGGRNRRRQVLGDGLLAHAGLHRTTRAILVPPRPARLPPATNPSSRPRRLVTEPSTACPPVSAYLRRRHGLMRLQPLLRWLAPMGWSDIGRYSLVI